MKNKKTKRIQVEFEKQHLLVLISALETYSRLQSGQIKTAIDEVYFDRGLTYDESQFIENVVRFVAFPPNIKREYDGHGEFYDQYNNEYSESGEIVKESEDWKLKKNRPHLDHANSSFGVGCQEMIRGTIAWEIKKAIEEYLHYERNKGFRDMGVDGDGVLNISKIPDAKIIDPDTKQYWIPTKHFLIPKRYQKIIETFLKNKKYNDAWVLIDKIFKKKPLPKGKLSKIEKHDGSYYVVVEKPYKPLKDLF
jgi:hypothetical protein